jgi:hypothetical protein
VLQVVDRNRLVDGGDLFPDGLDPERQFPDFGKQLGVLPLRFLFNSHVAPLQKCSRRLPEGQNMLGGFCYRMPFNSRLMSLGTLNGVSLA